ncbi:hypothetical protein CWC25_19860 [Pseudoalteromonas sp. S4389]|uniref:hypothetical protein n=1 Tax=Pseudoalteromonas sp. S4389 TaxID=579556 RepID=UPI001108E566|nr:hypothetical protein [Pseudoalteromonas sp. S4389]TMO40797.1 hypothetical protein CWC25_19860 [Pseudoalteromonas sp. S4389]
MKLSELLQNVKNKKWLLNSIAYYHENLFLLAASEFKVTDKSKKVIIVSRRNYNEKWQTYPSVSLKELKDILKLQKETSNSLIIESFSKNEQQEGYDVKTITFSEKLTDEFSKHILIPETELINHYYKDQKVVIEAQTPAGNLFYSKVEGKTKSAYKQGLVSSLESFCLSIGVHSDVAKVSLTQDDYASLLNEAILNTPFLSLYKTAAFDFKSSVDYKLLHSLYYGPLISAGIFIAGVNAFYMYKANSLETTLLSYQGGVSELLEQKQKIDLDKLYVEQVLQEFELYPNVHSHWDIAYKAISEGMDIQEFSGSKSNVTLRGFADSASSILAVISELPMVESAQFSGPVRKSGKRDYFMMELKVVGENEK